MTSVTLIPTNINDIPMLNGSNFKDWKEHIMFYLGCMDLDEAFYIKQPPPFTDVGSTDEKRRFEKWERSNRLSLMIIKCCIPKAFRETALEEITKASEYLEEIEKFFVISDETKKTTLLTKLTSMKYNGKGNVREHIVEMAHIAYKLRAMKIEISEDFLVHLVLISLPVQFGQLKVSYYSQRENWTLNELISYCWGEEERLKQERIQIAQLASTLKDNGKRKKGVEERAKKIEPTRKKQKCENDYLCYCCGKPGQWKKECA